MSAADETREPAGSAPAAGQPTHSSPGWPTRLVEGISASFLFVLMACSFIDVAGRFLFNQPLPGSVEISEILMALLVFSALPLVTAREEHLVVDFLDGITPARVARLRDVIVHLISAAAFFCLAWRLWVLCTEMNAYGAVSPFLALPIPPVVAFTSLSAFVSAVLMLYLAARSLSPVAKSLP